MFSSQGGVEE